MPAWRRSCGGGGGTIGIMFPFSSISDAAFFVSGLLAVSAAGLGLAFYIMKTKGVLRYPPTRDPNSDIANTRIMFQMMRDILEQQKDLARQLTVSLDNKIDYIKSAVDTSVDDLNQMRETARQLAVHLLEMRNELAEFEARMPNAGMAAANNNPAKAENTTIAHETAGMESTESLETKLEALARPALSEPPDGILEKWTGLDFGGLPPEEEPETYEEAPKKPHDAESAREAFRALLNLESEAAAKSSVQKKTSRKDEKTAKTPLQSLVYEYSDAGMDVAKISRSLGLGKGEVRLILNLRKDKER